MTAPPAVQAVDDLVAVTLPAGALDPGAPDLAATINRILDALPTDAHRRAAKREIARKAAEQVRTVNLHRWKRDPVAWAKERVAIALWSGQGRICTAVLDNPRVAVRSCNAAGKSQTVAVLAAWWLDIHEPGTAFVVTTAPTFRQVRGVAWRYIRQLHRKGKLFGRVNQTEWIGDDGDIVAFGAKPADNDQQGFLGTHATYVLVIIDEAAGVPLALWDAAESIAINDFSRVVAVGNPDDPTSEFARVSELAGWVAIKIAAADTPNFTGEVVPDIVRDNLISPSTVERMAERWGTDNPLYISRVLAEFPIDTEDRVVRASDIAKCRTETREWTPAQLTPVCLGVDLAEGGDLTVIRERRGMRAGRRWGRAERDPDEAIKMIVDAVLETGATVINMDAAPGWGLKPGLVAALKAAGVDMKRMTITLVRFGAAANEKAQYHNKRAEMWWGIGRLFSQEQVWDLSAMDHADDTVAELLSAKYAHSAGDRILVEDKDEIRKRIGHSPDDADALLLAYVHGEKAPTTITRPTGTLPVGAANIARRGTSLPRGGQIARR